MPLSKLFILQFNMSHSVAHVADPKRGKGGHSLQQQQYVTMPHHSVERFDKQKGPHSTSKQKEYVPKIAGGENGGASVAADYHGQYHKSNLKQEKKVRHGKREGRSLKAQGGRSYETTVSLDMSSYTGVDSLYSDSGLRAQPTGPVQVNSMNAPNNSTVQCGCENIDCQFCNLTLSVEMMQ